MSDELDELVAEVDEDAEELEIDLSEAADFEVIDGKRPVEIVAVKVGKSKNAPNHPYIEAKLKVIGDEDAGRIVFKTLMLKGKGAGITRRFLTVMESGIDFDAAPPRISPAKLVGLRGIAVLAADKREEYKHKTVVNDMLPFEDSAAAEADELD